MKRLLWLGVLLLAGCGPKDPEEAHFAGTWKYVEENGLTQAKEESTYVVTASHPRFRISQKSASSDYIEVFDGQTLYSKSVYTHASVPDAEPADEEPSSEPSPSDDPVSAKPMTLTETGSRRFWTNSSRQGTKEPGGLVCGRDTLLYQLANRRPDGDINEQDWVDAKTGILLKRVLTIYSSQVHSMVRQETWECQSIDYSQPSDTSFQKP